MNRDLRILYLPRLRGTVYFVSTRFCSSCSQTLYAAQTHIIEFPSSLSPPFFSEGFQFRMSPLITALPIGSQGSDFPSPDASRPVKRPRKNSSVPSVSEDSMHQDGASPSHDHVFISETLTSKKAGKKVRRLNVIVILTHSSLAAGSLVVLWM